MRPRAHFPSLVSSALPALLLVSACASGTSSSSSNEPFSDEIAKNETLAVEVRNDDTVAATIWALSSRGRRRLGMVVGHQTRTFELRWPRSGQLRLEIDFLAGPTCLTDDIQAHPGETVHLNIILTDISHGC